MLEALLIRAVSSCRAFSLTGILLGFLTLVCPRREPFLQVSILRCGAQGCDLGESGGQPR